MESNHKLGLFVSYYLSRFNKNAYENLGFGTQSETHQKIAKILGAKASTVKNWRDEFDPLFGHRAGWYQRPMIPSRVSVVQALEDLDEAGVRAIVTDILAGNIKNQDEYDQLLSIVVTDSNNSDISKFVLRGPTGRKAEDFFCAYHKQYYLPQKGKLIDCRDLGIGYDFKIEDGNENYFVEVKGLAEMIGGIAFTNKEWSTAKANGDNYYLCIVSNIKDYPEIKFIKNPFSKFAAKKNIYTTVQVSWSVSPKQLSEI